MASDGPKASDFPVIMETLALHERIAALEADLAKEKAENARMRGSLKFYADRKRYSTSFMWGPADVIIDGGLIARAALL